VDSLTGRRWSIPAPSGLPQGLGALLNALTLAHRVPQVIRDHRSQAKNWETGIQKNPAEKILSPIGKRTGLLARNCFNRTLIRALIRKGVKENFHLIQEKKTSDELFWLGAEHSEQGKRLDGSRGAHDRSCRGVKQILLGPKKIPCMLGKANRSNKQGSGCSEKKADWTKTIRNCGRGRRRRGR